MQITAACAVAAAVAWVIGYVASVLLMIAIVALVLRQGWAVLLCLVGILAFGHQDSRLPPDYREIVAGTVSLLMLAIFAAIQAQLRRRHQG